MQAIPEVSCWYCLNVMIGSGLQNAMASEVADVRSEVVRSNRSVGVCGC